MKSRWLLFLCLVPIVLLADPQGWEGAFVDQSKEHLALAFLNNIVIRGDERILDVGCGDGRVTASVAYRHPHCHVMGMDISAERIGKAQQYTQYQNLTFSVEDANIMDYDDRFDLVLSFNAFQYFSDPNKVLENIWKSLRRDGRLALQVPTGIPISLRQITEELLSHPKWQHYFEAFRSRWHAMKLEEYRKMVEQNHFVISRFQVIREDQTFTSVQDFKDFLKAWFPYLDPLQTQELKDEFVDEAVDLYCSRAPKDQHSYIHFTFDRLEIQAEKQCGVYRDMRI